MKKLLLLPFAVVMFFACGNEPATELQKDNPSISAASEQAFVATLEKHLKAVSERDLTSLRATMSPEGKMQLILPGTEIIETVDGFLDYHREWFQDTTWTFETKILNTEIGEQVGIGITEIVYREPERNGEPYFNRMIVSYALERINGNWYIIKDHASSVEKSTDPG
ncbi:nuclear transport factor 2 family protein [Lewinella sp. W8]|uniref:YybH family protein n=1 Tax=Lewinella sp. W8 TaxID=2528208 RepID=UPI001067DCDC|nr:nuclear transport factor 2 family protein [Lewinella sp. W8]MTB51715.1 hypothetical protein [Lewinella sp. W8]